MPTSKLPVEFVRVPADLIALAAVSPGLVCNLRPEQRPMRAGETADACERRLFLESLGDAFWLDSPTREFLKKLDHPVKVLMHFQGYGPTELGTAVIELQSSEWFYDYPKLHFVRPEGFEAIQGCPNFWGAFILALAVVPPETAIFARRDDTSRHYIELAQRLVQIPSPLSAAAF